MTTPSMARRMTRRSIRGFTWAVCGALSLLAAGSDGSAQVILLSGGFGSGGGELSGGEYRMNGTMGQTFADAALGARLVHGAGFWFVAAGTLVSVDNESEAEPGADIPTRYQLDQNYPNPFNPTTTIRFGVPEAARVEIAIYNVLGRRMRVLTDAEVQPGWYSVTWDGRAADGAAVPSGLYLVQMRARDFSATRKMMLLK